MATTTKKGLFKILPWFMVAILIFAFSLSGWQAMPVKYAQAAVPTFTASIKAKDGSTDKILLTFSEAVSDTSGVAGEVLEVADLTPSGTDGLTISSISHTANSKYAVLTMSAPINLGGAGELLLAPAAGSIFDNGGTNACAQAPIDINADASIDATGPTVSNIHWLDSDADGDIDKAEIQFGEPIQDSTVTVAEFEFDNDTTNDSTGEEVASGGSSTVASIASSAVVNDEYYALTATTGISGTDAANLHITGTTLTDLLGNAVVAADNVGTDLDRAAPIFTSATTDDNDGDGTVDRLLVVFSETVTITDGGTDDDITLTASSGTATIVAGSYGKTGVSQNYTITVSATGDTAITIDPTYATAGTGSITDGTTEMANAETVTGTDGAAPAPLSAGFYDTVSSDGKLDLIVVSWSETLSAVVDGSSSWAISSAANFSDLTEGTVECSSGAAAGDECHYNFTTSTVKTDVGDLTLAYTKDNTVKDASNNYSASVTFTSASTPVAFTDGAKPVLVSAQTLDVGADGTTYNGKVDHLKLTFSEAIDDSAIDSYAAGVDYTPTSLAVANVTGEAVDAVEILADAEDDQYLYIVFDEDAGACSVTDQTGCDTDAVDQDITWTGASVTIQDASANVIGDLASGGVTEADTAKPYLVSAQTLDVGADGTTYNGKVDHLKLIFSEAIDDSALQGYAAGVDFTPSTLAVANVTGEAVDAVEILSDTEDNEYLYIVFTEDAGTCSISDQSGCDTDAVDQDITWTGATAQVRDIAGNDANNLITASVTESDNAAPYIVGANYYDNNSNGTIDYTVLVFSEAVDDSEYLDKSSTISTGGTLTTAAIVAAATVALDAAADDEYITLAIASGTANTTNITATLDTVAADMIEDMNSVSSLDQSSVTLYDKAAPVIATSTPADGYAGYDRTGDIAITFSEAMTTASVESALSYSPTFGTPVYTWTVSDTVVTINPSITLSSSTSYTVTLTSAPSAASGDGNLSDTITFTSASGTSSTSGGGGGGGSVTSTAPTVTLGTVSDLTAGETVNLTWSVGGSGIDTVALYYSTDSGTTYNLIAYNVSRTLGTYSWTVPSVSSSTAVVKIMAYDSGKALLDTDVSSVFSISVSSTEEVTETIEEETVWPEYTTTDSEGRTVANDSGETGVSPLTGETEAVSTVVTGEYIRAYGYSTVYYVDENLNRRPFWDSATFFTYADSWDEVVWVTNATLATLTIGQPMLPAPGVVLVKIQSTPETYAVEAGNILRWIPDEETATTLYGESWSNYVIDLEPTVFSKYTVGDNMSVSDTVDTSIMKTRTELATLSM